MPCADFFFSITCAALGLAGGMIAALALATLPRTPEDFFND